MLKEKSLQSQVLNVHPALSIILGSVLIALFAQIRIPVPFSPVPITGQSFGVILIGGLLGSRLGAYAVAMYLFEGAMGLPVFAGFAAGWAYLFSTTGGYLLGFVPAAYLMGRLMEKGWSRTYSKLFLATTLSTVIIFASGLLWLSRFIDGDELLMIGLIPFIPGAIIKISAVSVVLKRFFK